MNTTRARPVLKYPGAKWNLAETIVNMIPEHHTYLEPFFGSGAVFFSKEPSNIEVINDLDESVYLLYKTIRDNHTELANIISLTPYSRKEYEDTYQDAGTITDLEKVRQFLIKCWQGHGCRTNGYKVGWKNDVQGREQMYAAYNWYRLPSWIGEIVDRLKQVQIENQECIKLIKRFDYSNVFIYLDPPYLLETRTAKQYKHEMTDKDHEELLQLITNHKAKIMISGYDSELYNKHLSDWNRHEMEATAEYGLKRTEVIWTNYETDNQLTLDQIIT